MDFVHLQLSTECGKSRNTWFPCQLTLKHIRVVSTKLPLTFQQTMEANMRKLLMLIYGNNTYYQAKLCAHTNL